MDWGKKMVETLKKNPLWLVLLLAIGMLLMTVFDFSSQMGVLNQSEKDAATSSVAVKTVVDTPSEQPTVSTSAVNAAESQLEKRMCQVLGQIAGVGKVEVAITMAASPQQEYALNLKKSQQEISEKDEKGGTRTTIEKNQEDQLVLVPASGQSPGAPLVIKEIGPEIKGVVVICEGAGDARVREELSRTIQAMLNLPSYRINVMPKEK